MVRLDDDRVVLTHYDDYLGEAELERMARELRRQERAGRMRLVERFVAALRARGSRPNPIETRAAPQR